jgi:predicted phage terminase large subunit-like protein
MPEDFDPAAFDDVDDRELMRAQMRRHAREEFSTFFNAHLPSPDYVFGTHTLAVLERLDRAVKDFENGIGSHLIVTIPFRHGKSDIVSRRLPVWFLGRNPDSEVILACYSDQLASDLSRKARECFRHTAQRMFGVGLSMDSSAVNHWEVAGKRGNMTATGLGGSIVGRGAHLLIVDDYIKKREEAESELLRNKQWNSFNDDLRTRLAPVHIVIICATRWHEDDIVGRALNKCDPGHKDYDPDAPVFEELRFPMQDEETGEWLFPQRFPHSWYRQQKSNLGTYGWNSLAQQNPQPREGNLLRADRVVVLGEEEFKKRTVDARWSRGWDLASSKKELVKPDPDYTVGTKASYHKGCVYVADVKRTQHRAVKRDNLIKACALADGSNVPVYVECVAGYTDTYDRMEDMLAGKSVVRKYTPVVDKVARATNYEAFFELGQVFVLEADWNEDWIKEFNAFPKGKHDDQVDSLVVALNEQIQVGTRIGISS